MSLPAIMAGMPNDIDDLGLEQGPDLPETSATPGTLLISSSLLSESGPVENMLPSPRPYTVTLSE